MKCLQVKIGFSGLSFLSEKRRDFRFRLATEIQDDNDFPSHIDHLITGVDAKVAAYPEQLRLDTYGRYLRILVGSVGPGDAGMFLRQAVTIHLAEQKNRDCPACPKHNRLERPHLDCGSTSVSVAGINPNLNAKLSFSVSRRSSDSGSGSLGGRAMHRPERQFGLA